MALLFRSQIKSIWVIVCFAGQLKSDFKAQNGSTEYYSKYSSNWSCMPTSPWILLWFFLKHTLFLSNINFKNKLQYNIILFFNSYLEPLYKSVYIYFCYTIHNLSFVGYIITLIKKFLIYVNVLNQIRKYVF